LARPLTTRDGQKQARDTETNVAKEGVDREGPWRKEGGQVDNMGGSTSGGALSSRPNQRLKKRESPRILNTGSYQGRSMKGEGKRRLRKN